uniref:Ovule protein n=1 Tax=Brugia timori TaxID=42155 RepID=A0A0R3QH67_9BILA
LILLRLQLPSYESLAQLPLVSRLNHQDRWCLCFQDFFSSGHSLQYYA